MHEGYTDFAEFWFSSIASIKCPLQKTRMGSSKERKWMEMSSWVFVLLDLVLPRVGGCTSCRTHQAEWWGVSDQMVKYCRRSVPSQHIKIKSYRIKRWSVGTPFFLLMPGESAVLPTCHTRHFPLDPHPLDPLHCSKVAAHLLKTVIQQCRIRSAVPGIGKSYIVLFTWVSCNPSISGFCKGYLALAIILLKGLGDKWYSAIIILTSPIASMYGIFPYIYHKHQGWM